MLREKGVPVKALVRDVEAAKKVLPSSGDGLDIVLGDVFQYSTLPKAFEGANALVIATGARDPRDPFGPFNVDYQGTENLVALAKAYKVKHVVLVTSIGADDPFNPLNLFW